MSVRWLDIVFAFLEMELMCKMLVGNGFGQ